MVLSARLHGRKRKQPWENVCTQPRENVCRQPREGLHEKRCMVECRQTRGGTSPPTPPRASGERLMRSEESH